MANNLGIQEVTMAQLVDSTNAVNLYANRPHQSGTGGVKVVRVTDHADNVALEEDDPDKMAIFFSAAHGQPWIKDQGIKHIISEGDALALDATVIFPDFDYSTF